MTSKALPATFSFVLAAALATAPLAFAQAPLQPAPDSSATAAAPLHTPDPHRQVMRIARQLNLTADQTSKLEPIFADRDQKIAALRADSSLSPKSQKQQMRQIQQNTRSQLSTVLTADQLSQLESMQRAHARQGQAQPATTPSA
jgi:protein CpxP